MLPVLPFGEGGLDFQPHPTSLSSALEPSAGEARNRLLGPSLALELSRLNWGFGGKMKRKAKQTRANSQVSCLHWVQMTFCSLQPRLKERFLCKDPQLAAPLLARPQAHTILAVSTAPVPACKGRGPNLVASYYSPPHPRNSRTELLHSPSLQELNLAHPPTWAILQLGAQPPCHPLGL